MGGVELGVAGGAPAPGSGGPRRRRAARGRARSRSRGPSGFPPRSAAGSGRPSRRRRRCRLRSPGAARAGSSCPDSWTRRVPRSSAGGGRLLDVDARLEGAHPDPQLVARRGSTSRSRRGRSGGRSRPRDHRCAGGMDLESAGQWRIGGLVAVGGQDPPPAEGVDDQRCGDRAAVGVDRDRAVAVAAAPRPFTVAVSKVGVASLPEQLAELSVVEGRESPGQVERGSVGRVDEELAEALQLEVHQAQRLAASRWGCRRPRSGARRSRSGRGAGRRRRSRTVRAQPPARRNSPRRSARRGRPSKGVRSSPRLVARIGMTAGYRSTAFGTGGTGLLISYYNARACVNDRTL